MARKERNWGWKICCTLAVITMIAAFTPYFLPTGKIEPKLAGMPYTLWSGIVLCFVMVGITAVATMVHPGGKAVVPAEEGAATTAVTTKKER